MAALVSRLENQSQPPRLRGEEKSAKSRRALTSVCTCTCDVTIGYGETEGNNKGAGMHNTFGAPNGNFHALRGRRLAGNKLRRYRPAANRNGNGRFSWNIATRARALARLCIYREIKFLTRRDNKNCNGADSTTTKVIQSKRASSAAVSRFGPSREWVYPPCATSPWRTRTATLPPERPMRRDGRNNEVRFPSTKAARMHETT